MKSRYLTYSTHMCRGVTKGIVILTVLAML